MSISSENGQVESLSWGLCSSLKMNYSFDFAFNQIVTDIHNQNSFHHYLYSHKQFLKLYFDQYHRLQVIPFEFQQQNEFLENFPSDYGFSLHSFSPFSAKICSAKIHKKYLTCIDVDYSTKSKPRMKNKETFLFEIPSDFRPSMAFQHIGYDHYQNSRFMVILVEQNLKLIQDKNKKAIKRHFDRRWQVYLFNKLDHIINLTISAVTPDYLHTIPDELEITGIFGWTRKNTDIDEYMIIAFNGTNHLYCLNDECSNSENYKTFMSKCKTPSALISLNQQQYPITQTGFIVTKCCGQWTEFKGENNQNDDDDEDDGSQWQMRDGKLYRVRSVRSTNLNYVIWSLVILATLVLLLLLYWIYSCINETRYDNKMKFITATKNNDNHNHHRHHNCNHHQQSLQTEKEENIDLEKTLVIGDKLEMNETKHNKYLHLAAIELQPKIAIEEKQIKDDGNDDDDDDDGGNDGDDGDADVANADADDSLAPR